MKINKTNAARLLDKAGVSYELIPYEVDPENLAATHVAEQLGEEIERATAYLCASYPATWRSTSKPPPRYRATRVPR